MKRRIFNGLLLLAAVCVSSSCIMIGGVFGNLNHLKEPTVYRVNAHGINPVSKSFYIVAADQTLQNTLEFTEYSNLLKGRLYEAGYRSTPMGQAALRIEFEYGVGPSYWAAQTKNFVSVMQSRVVKDIEDGSTLSKNDTCFVQYNNGISGLYVAKMTADGSYFQVSNAWKGSREGDKGVGRASKDPDIPAYITIRAFDVQTDRPIWEVTVNDQLSSANQLQTVMPWMLLSAQQYFGKSSNGERYIKVKKNKSFMRKYNLVWPYDNKTIKLHKM